ncbi:MAG: YvcK family protein [Coriobacteriaceae bacterium]|nr:YvcK family protein [Coriobacteriaceae bacterium]
MSGLIAEAFGHDPSATAAFAALPELNANERPSYAKAVVIGGGTGAPVSIRTLLSMGIDTSAVVAMADDGGSTGILRDQAGATAPGDIRKCITAMAGNPDDPLTQAFKVRFGFAENHTLGNLMLSALEVTSGGFPQAIDVCERLLNVRGHVYPSTLDRVTLVAQTRDGRMLKGQAVANHSRTALRKVALDAEGGIFAYEPALEVIRQADLIVLGPGSLYTSIIPNLLVPGITDAIANSDARVVFVCSLADMQGETRGMTALDHFEAIASHGAEGHIDYMLAHDSMRHPVSNIDPDIRDVWINDSDIAKIEARGTHVVLTDLVDDECPTWHDPAKLRKTFSRLLGAPRGTRFER